MFGRRVKISIFGLCGVVVGLVYIVIFSKLQHISYEQALSEMWFMILAVVALGYFLGYIRAELEPVDINSRDEYPSYALSNLYQCPFYFDGVFCTSREGLLQAFKTNLIHEQERLCGLLGHEAQKAGQEYNNWKDDQVLYWKDKSFKRDSKEYWDLLVRVFDPENMRLDVVAALLATRNRKLIHSIGKVDINDTVLTEQELCLFMTNARIQLKEKGLVYVG